MLWLRAKIVPNAAPAAATAPILSSSERVWCCLAGAMATPAGLAAAPPDVGTLSAVAAPTGSVCGLGFGPSGTVVVCAGAAFGDGWSCCAPEASGYVVTGCSGACDGFTLVPGDVGCCAGFDLPARWVACSVPGPPLARHWQAVPDRLSRAGSVARAVSLPVVAAAGSFRVLAAVWQDSSAVHEARARSTGQQSATYSGFS